MADQTTREENEQALKAMTADQEALMKALYGLSKEQMIDLDEDGWAELLDRLFDLEIEDENRASAKTVKHDRMVSEIITMMESV